ncbi:efflux RND transporter permease subunit [Sphingobacterium lactis]|uniref:Hydrophobic/amphiphilic exporter-1, HAE1 family n=1 Tax=Sphingobacterium lactis TaxID=797291 RepID=A0A1H5WC09_9SPHI|nr:efflux RND transporter permease subunit [Sphingobacterium lactis]SEF96920.1 hydrophobic/amphiphilic exporter-1, HAE1 family [Sphingobacterium lactis]
MFEKFIKRPVLSLVISIFITLLGLLALFTLPITQFPDIVPPSVVVTANYTGANAEVSTNAVAIPLEKAINGVAGMTYMSSVSTNNGNTLIQVFFEVGTDPDIAAVNVQNRVTTVLDELPEEVIKAGVTTEKEVNSMLMYLNLYTDDETADERFIYNFTDINILKELKRIEGVGFAQIMGMKDYAMRIWVKPDRLSAYSISTEELVTALRRQNIEAAPGQTGISSDKTVNMQQYVLRYPGKFTEISEYENIPIRANVDGSIIRVKDIADVEFGSLDYEMVSKTDGRPSASIMIKQLPGSNAQEVIQRVKDRMAELKEATFPPGMTYTMGYDVSRFLNASISSVLITLVEAFILVFLVVFIFLQDFRATIIPILAVPVCLIGSLFFMQMMGFSINLLTLFALVLAIGIVVDNGIVVVEAVYAKMEEEHLSPMEATLAAMSEVGSAVIAITLVMSAVFVPVAFLSGPVGIFYRQFSLTLAAAIVISGINALTLTPALCAIILRSPHDKKPGNGLLDRFFRGFNKVYDKISGNYKGLLSKIAGRRIITLLGLVIMFVATWGSAAILPGGFIPTEDQGMIYVAVTTPPGATVDRTEAVLNEVDEISRSLDVVETVSILAGYSIVTEVSGASYGMGMINLKAWEDRDQSIDDVMTILREKTSHIADAEIEFFPPPTVPGFGNSSGFELRLLDRSGNEDLNQTNEVVNDFIAKLQEDEVIESASTTFDVNFPQYMLKIDYDLAAKKGISVENSMNTLQTLLGSLYATNFIRYGQMYKVMVQSDAFSRQRPEDVLNLYVKTEEGEMVPYSSFMTMERIYGPEQITRYNMFTSAMITGQAAPGFSSGQAIDAVERIAAELPQGYTIEWSGMTREQKISGNQAAYIFLLCLVFVYLLLAAQYESFLLPMPVILCLPAGLFGAFLFLKVFGLENNIYAQVSLVMLIGLLGKNAILIVEYANLKRKQGMDVLTASIEGAVARLRPILMTSFAFAAGLIPLMLANGAGAIGNRTIGSAAVGGMVIGTIIGVIVIPGLVVLFSKRDKKDKVKKRKRVAEAVVAGAVLLFIASCSVPKTTTEKQVSTDITGAAKGIMQDSVTLGTLPWNEVFTDPHLKGLIDSALLNNLDVRQAFHRIEMAQANFKFRKSALYPSVDAAVEGGLRKYGHYTESGIGNYDSNFSENLTDDEKLPEPFIPDYFVGVRASWELDLWGKLRNRRESAFLQLMSQSEFKRLIETELIASIASSYYELLSLDEKIKVYEENITLHERALEIIEAQKDAGRADELAVQQFKSILAESKANRELAEQEILNYEHQINSLLGRVYQPIARNSAPIGGNMLFQDLSVGRVEDLLNNRLDIRQAGMELKADFHELESSRLAFLPTVAISPYLGLQSFSFDKLFTLDKSVTYGLFGGITMPIFRQRELRSEYEIMKATYGISFLEYEKVVLNAVNEVSLALNTQDAIAKREVHVKDQVAALEASIVAAEELFIAGRITYLDIITAQKGLIAAQVADVDVNKEKMLNQVVLYKALGGGWKAM